MHGEKGEEKNFRAEELAENIKPRGRTGKMTRAFHQHSKKKTKKKKDHRAKTNRVIKQ